MFERFTDHARRVVVLGQEEARRLRHNYIGTEHLLLGLIREEDGVAARVLVDLGLTLDRTRDKVEETIGRGQEASQPSLPFTPRAKRILELSLHEALDRGDDHIGTEHILLGIVREGEGVAAQLMAGHGAGPDLVRERVVRAISTDTAAVRPQPAGVPADLSRVLAALADIARAKAAAIEAQDFERAATLRDEERRLQAERDAASPEPDTTQ